MGIVETMKDVLVLVQKTDNIDLVKQILSLQVQVSEMQDENRRLRERVKELEAAAIFAKTMRFEQPFYFAADDKVPHCAQCWESDRRAIHLKSDWKDRRWECYRCKNVYLLDDTD
jgi:hypothetical protein